MTNELQRIANVLGVNMNSDNLCLLIQDKIKEKDKSIKKLTFTNVMLKNQADKQKTNPIVKSIKINDLEYIDEIKNGFDKAYNGLRKEHDSILEANYNLRLEVERYKQEALINKIKKIEGVR